MSHLAVALAKVDEVLAALQNGTLITTGAGSPNKISTPAAPAAAAARPPSVTAASAVDTAGKQQSNKSKKVAKKKAGDEVEAKKTAATDGDAFDKAQLGVGRVVSVEDHPSGSEKLWLLKVDVTAGVQRQVVAGLRQHVSREELTGRLVALVLNLKPAKLAGELSEAMVLAADKQEGETQLVRILAVPDGCQPGDVIHRDGMPAPNDFPKECKSKVWKEVVDGLAVQAGIACYQGTALVTAKGRITVEGMPDGASIH